jgi:hypothetical protein
VSDAKAGSRRPIRTLLVVAAVVLAAGCSSDDDDGDSEARWVLQVAEGVAADGARAPEVSGTFGDPFIDRYLGPEAWDPEDGAPPDYGDAVQHSELIAFGELRSGVGASDEREGDAILSIYGLGKGDVDDLAMITELPAVGALPAEVTILVGPGEDGSPHLLETPTSADHDRTVQVLLGGSANRDPDAPLDDLVALSDVIVHGRSTGATDGAWVEVEVFEVFAGDDASIGDTVWLAIDAAEVDRLSSPQEPAGVWFAVGDGGDYRSVTTTYPGGDEVTITDYVRGLLSAA